MYSVSIPAGLYNTRPSIIFGPARRCRGALQWRVPLFHDSTAALPSINGKVVTLGMGILRNAKMRNGKMQNEIAEIRWNPGKLRNKMRNFFLVNIFVNMCFDFHQGYYKTNKEI